jgi:hypothetical protein
MEKAVNEELVKGESEGKAVKACHDFDQYDGFTVDDCNNEQTRLIQNISMLDKDRKTWLSANKSMKSDFEKNLRHINWRIRFLQSNTDLEFYKFMNECIKNQEEESRKRLFPSSKK